MCEQNVAYTESEPGPPASGLQHSVLVLSDTTTITITIDSYRTITIVHTITIISPICDYWTKLMTQILIKSIILIQSFVSVHCKMLP